MGDEKITCPTCGMQMMASQAENQVVCLHAQGCGLPTPGKRGVARLALERAAKEDSPEGAKAKKALTNMTGIVIQKPL